MVYRLLFICCIHSNPQALMLEIEAHLALFPVGLPLSIVTNEVVTWTQHSHVKMYLWGARSHTDPQNLVVHQLMILLRVPVVLYYRAVLLFIHHWLLGEMQTWTRARLLSTASILFPIILFLLSTKIQIHFI